MSRFGFITIVVLAALVMSAHAIPTCAHCNSTDHCVAGTTIKRGQAQEYKLKISAPKYIRLTFKASSYMGVFVVNKTNLDLAQSGSSSIAAYDAFNEFYDNGRAKYLSCGDFSYKFPNTLSEDIYVIFMCYDTTDCTYSYSFTGTTYGGTPKPVDLTSSASQMSTAVGAIIMVLTSMFAIIS